MRDGMKKQETKIVGTVDELVTAFGGLDQAATALALKSKTALHNWKARGGVPMRRFFQVRKGLSRLGYVPSDTLFREASAERRMRRRGPLRTQNRNTRVEAAARG
jgi:hypothetical protein